MERMKSHESSSIQQSRQDGESQHLSASSSTTEVHAVPNRHSLCRIRSKPNKSLARGIWIRMLWGLSFHAPALAISAVLCFINSGPRFWFETETSVDIYERLQLRTTNILHLLQIAAKAYELLLILSLSTVILGTYRKLLITHGLPLGLITSGYSTGSLTYLRGSALLNGMMANWQYMVFGIFFTSTGLLSLLASPACAILVVPIPGWWPMGSNYAELMPPILVQETWPSVLNLSTLQPPDDWCHNNQSLFEDSCPGYGYPEIHQWSSNWEKNFLQGNITMSSNMATSKLRRQIFTDLPSNDSATFITTISSVTGLAVGSYFDFVTHHDVGRISHAANVKIRTLEHERNFQPLVQARCEAFDADAVRTALQNNDTAAYPYWPMSGVECFDDAVCASWQNKPDQDRLLETRHWDYTPQSPNISFHWVEHEGPLSAVFNLPYINGSMVDNTGQHTWRRQGYHFMACSFVSRWIPSVLTAELTRTDVLQSNITNPGIFSSVKGLPPTSIGYPVQISKTWAAYLDDIGFNLSRAGGYHNDAIANLLANFVRQLDQGDNDTIASYSFLDPDSKQYWAGTTHHVIERVIGTALTDALSRVGLSYSNRPTIVTELTSDRIRYFHLSHAAVRPGFGPMTNYTIVPNPGNSTYPSKRIDSGDSPMVLFLNKTIEQIAGEFRSYHAYGLEVERYGYGLGAPSPTLTFALVVVYLYIATAITYIGFSLVSFLRETWRAGPNLQTSRVAEWNDIQALLELAWKSKSPPELKNAGASLVPLSKKWRRIVVVRAKGDQSLELVMKHKEYDESQGSGKDHG